MSGEIHSGVQEVLLTSGNEEIIPLDKKCMENDNPENNILVNDKLCILNSQVNTAVSNVSDGSLCCEICNIRVTSAKILQRHLEGRKHISKSERKGKTFHCELCDIKANSELQLNIHLSSSKHKARVAREEFKEFTDIPSYSIGIYVLLFCAFCIILNLVILVEVAF